MALEIPIRFSRSVSIPRFSGRTPYVAPFSSLPVKNEFGAGTDAPRAIVFITDPAEPLLMHQDLLRQTYGLIGAGIRTAVAVVQSGTVEAVADAIGVSENTIRTQLKQIYAKTNVDSRARLVKLIYSLSSTRPVAMRSMRDVHQTWKDRKPFPTNGFLSFSPAEMPLSESPPAPPSSR